VEFKETHYCTAYAKWGAGSLKALSGGILHSRPVQTAIRVKKHYHFAWLVYPSEVILFLSAETN